MSTTTAGIPQILDVDFAADLPRLLEIERECFGIGAFSQWDLQDYLRQGWKMRKVVVDGVIAGYCMAKLEWQDYHIGNMSVVPAFQRRGIARLMMDDILAEAARVGAPCSRLEVSDKGLAAQALYKKYGYVEYGSRRPRAYPDGSGAIFMQKDLQPQS